MKYLFLILLFTVAANADLEGDYLIRSANNQDLDWWENGVFYQVGLWYSSQEINVRFCFSIARFTQGHSKIATGMVLVTFVELLTTWNI